MSCTDHSLPSAFVNTNVNKEGKKKTLYPVYHGEIFTNLLINLFIHAFVFGDLMILLFVYFLRNESRKWGAESECEIANSGNASAMRRKFFVAFQGNCWS